MVGLQDPLADRLQGSELITSPRRTSEVTVVVFVSWEMVTDGRRSLVFLGAGFPESADRHYVRVRLA
jgi:hypothetical protein